MYSFSCSSGGQILKSISQCQNEGITQFWIIWVGPKYNHMYPYKREAERDFKHTHTHTHTHTHRRRQSEEVATSQRILAARSIHMIAFRALPDNPRSSPHVKLGCILISVKSLLPY